MPSAPKMRDTCASSRGDPTRMAPCLSALTRSMLPRRSASAPSRANTRWFTSWATSTSVAYAGTSTPYKLESREAKRVRSCVLVTVVAAPIDVTLPSDGEVHSLGERQLAGVVDRVGGSPHVGAPGVGPGLAAAAGVLLSSEGTSDLGPRRADVDVDDAAVRALCGHEPLRLRLVRREQTGGQPLRHRVVERDGLVEVVVRQHVEQRRERLVAHHVGLVVEAHDGRSGVEGVRRYVLELSAATRDQLAALVRSLLDGLAHALVGRSVDERSDQRAFLHRVADGQAAVGRDQTVRQLVDHAVVCNDAAHGRASLTRRPGCGEHDTARGQVEIRGRAHHGGVVPAQLEQGAAQTGRDTRSDGASHRGGPGGTQQRDAGVASERLADFGATDEDLAEVRRYTHIRDRPGKNRVTGTRWEGFQLRRLPDDGVSADQRDGGVPGPDRGREVEGTDHTDDAQWVPGLHQSVAGAF